MTSACVLQASWDASKVDRDAVKREELYRRAMSDVTAARKAALDAGIMEAGLEGRAYQPPKPPGMVCGAVLPSSTSTFWEHPSLHAGIPELHVGKTSLLLHDSRLVPPTPGSICSCNIQHAPDMPAVVDVRHASMHAVDGAQCSPAFILGCFCTTGQELCILQAPQPWHAYGKGTVVGAK